MFEMNEGRISFADTLRPPAGYELSFAVGTTYSLDLRALMGICIPLALGFEPESLNSINPVSLFAALNRLQGKLAIYCDKGSVHADVPANPKSSGLLMLLEGMVHQVHVNWRHKDALSSFHPKVWVIEYVARNEKPLYRLIVMSRNLTFDTSWDTVISIDGHLGTGNECSEHVAQFLEFLAVGDSCTTTERDDTRKRESHTTHVRQLAQAVRNVTFNVDDHHFDSIDFLPFGPQSDGAGSLMDARESALMTERWRSALVVSPFLSDSMDSPLMAMAKNRSGASGRYVLLSREDSLSALNANVRDAYECFCPASSLADVELDGEDNPNAADYSNLHAKVYFVQDAKGRRSLYTGSLNASRNGTYNNVESLLRLGVRPGCLTFQQMLKPLIGDGGKEPPPFAPYVPRTPQDTEIDDEAKFRRAFRIASRLVAFKSVDITADDDTATIAATVKVSSSNKACQDIALTLRPLLSAEGAGLVIGSKILTQTLTFAGLRPEQVSAFFFIKGTDSLGRQRECVTVCPHDQFHDKGLSLESRSSTLLKSIVQANGNALAQYLAHAFDLPEAAYALKDDEHMESVTTHARHLPVPPGLYERLLDMADMDPTVFARASQLMNLLPNDIHHEDLDALRKMVEVFSRAVR